MWLVLSRDEYVFRFVAYKNNGGMLQCDHSGMICFDFDGSSDKLLHVSFMNCHAFIMIY